VSIWFDCDSCWDGFLDAAPCRVEAVELVPASAEATFAAIVEPAQRVRWSPGMIDARWLTPPPHGPGSERRVNHEALRSDQRVVAWEPGRRFSFYLTRAGTPAASQFMEEFMLSDEPFGTRVRWRIGWRLRLPLRALGGLSERAAGPMFRSYLGGLRRYLDAGAPK